MYQILYASSAAVPFTTADLLALLDKSRVNNTRVGVTGMLLYRDGNFIQVLEGEEGAVRATFARIERDPRHKGTLVLLKGEVPERQFPDWSMGFRDLSSAEVRATPGFNEFLNTPLTGAEFADPARCHKLLLTFKRSTR